MRPFNEYMDRQIGVVHQVHEHGFVRLLDYMGDDEAVVQAARVSYGQGTRSVSDDRRLIRYLMRHRHTSPFEMCEIKLHIKLPIFVARQWIRQRTASVNEVSGRYSILPGEWYIPSPEAVAAQSSTNKQGRGAAVDADVARDVAVALDVASRESRAVYEWLLNDAGDGRPDREDDPMVARELARIGLTLNTYTEWVWKIDLHNLLNFLAQRMDTHAQLEIRQYAAVIAAMVRQWVPLTWEAFEDYRLFAVTLSRSEAVELRRLVELAGLSAHDVAVVESKREHAAFLAVLGAA